jgi:hypothetical protein
VSWERGAAIASLALAAAIAAILFLVPSPTGGPLPVRQPSGESLTHVNAAVGYAFHYPAGWVATDTGATSTVRNPNRSVVITFGPGADPDLQHESDSLVGSLRADYTNVDVLATDHTTIQGSPATMVSGMGTTGAGVRIRFLAITVATGGGTYDIAVFTDADADPAAVQPPAQAIVGSFRPPVAATPA